MSVAHGNLGGYVEMGQKSAEQISNVNVPFKWAEYRLIESAN